MIMNPDCRLNFNRQLQVIQNVKEVKIMTMKAIRKAYKAIFVIAVLAISGEAMATEEAASPMIELKKRTQIAQPGQQ